MEEAVKNDAMSMNDEEAGMEDGGVMSSDAPTEEE